MRASVIVPVFNRFDLTAHFIMCCYPRLSSEDELIIIDNASTDETLDKMIQVVDGNKENLRYYRNTENVGFGEGNNIGARVAKGRYLIFTSNDVEIHGDFITPTVQALQDDFVAVGPQVIRYPTGWNDIWEGVPPIHYIVGWYMAMSRFNFVQAGQFDKDMFLDYEDLDLSYRLQKNGIRLQELKLPVAHVHTGQSTGALPQPRVEYTNRSVEVFGRKNNFKRK